MAKPIDSCETTRLTSWLNYFAVSLGPLPDDLYTKVEAHKYGDSSKASG